MINNDLDMIELTQKLAKSVNVELKTSLDTPNLIVALRAFGYFGTAVSISRWYTELSEKCQGEFDVTNAEAIQEG